MAGTDADNSNRQQQPARIPLPKPVRHDAKNRAARPRYEEQAQAVDTDEFELDRPASRRVVRHAQRVTLGQALGVALSRVGGMLYRPIRKEFMQTFGGRQTASKRRQQARSRRRRKNTPRLNYRRVAGVSALVLVFISLIVMGLVSVFSRNAMAVYLNDELIGYIARSHDIDEIAIQRQAVSRREADLGASIRVNQSVRTETVSASRRSIQPFNDIIDQISREFTFKIAGIGIYVDGMEIAVLRTRAEAEQVASRLYSPFVNENTIHSEFVEPWELRDRSADQEDLVNIEEAVFKLDVKTRATETYTIRDGDTLGAIAIRYSTTLDKIYLDNPSLNNSPFIRPGSTIQLEVVKPFLSVRTIDETTKTETIPAQTEERQNPLEARNFMRVVEEGREGVQETTLRITRVNGVQVGTEEVISTHITIPPINRIVEVGTAEAQADRR
jgi:LysM repeat protein